MSNLLGSAAWSADTGHWRYHALGADGMPEEGRYLLLGECPNRRGFLHVRAPLQHMLSIAPTRSGKGVSLIVPNLLIYGGSILVVDPKGENAWLTAAFRRQRHSQKTVILDPWGEVNRRYGSMGGVSETIARFNRMRYGFLSRFTAHFRISIASLTRVSFAMLISRWLRPVLCMNMT